jgi:hypothetical protein
VGCELHFDRHSESVCGVTGELCCAASHLHACYQSAWLRHLYGVTEFTYQDATFFSMKPLPLFERA